MSVLQTGLSPPGEPANNDANIRLVHQQGNLER